MKTAKSKARRAKQPATKKAKEMFSVPVIVERDESGFLAYCPTLDGCHTQGRTYEETLENIKEAIELFLDDLRSHGESVPENDIVSYTTVEVRR